MNLTKGKISKLYDKKRQTLKRKRAKKCCKKKTFRNKRKVNLARKTLKKIHYKKQKGGEEDPKNDDMPFSSTLETPDVSEAPLVSESSQEKHVIGTVGENSVMKDEPIIEEGNSDSNEKHVTINETPEIINETPETINETPEIIEDTTSVTNDPSVTSDPSVTNDPSVANDPSENNEFELEDEPILIEDDGPIILDNNGDGEDELNKSLKKVADYIADQVAKKMTSSGQQDSFLSINKAAQTMAS